MSLRCNAFFIVFGLCVGTFGMYLSIDARLIQTPIGILDAIFIPLYPLGIYAFLVLLPSYRVKLDEQGIQASGYYPLVQWWPITHRTLPLAWEHVTFVGSVFPIWFPFRMIYIMGYNADGDGVLAFLGHTMTKPRASLEYAFTHLPDSALSEEVRTLKARYAKT